MLFPISLLRNSVTTMLILFLFPSGTLPDVYFMFITGIDRKRPKPQWQSGGTELFMLKRRSIPLDSFITWGKILPKPFLWYQMAMLVPCHWGLLSNVPIQVYCSPWTSVKGLCIVSGQKLRTSIVLQRVMETRLWPAQMQAREAEKLWRAGRISQGEHPKRTKKKSHEISR